MEDVLTTEYDGCGRCLVAVRRLSRKTDKTSSPQRQGDQDLRAAADAGGHIIAWADDWEVSGATDPMTRKGLGPWLRGEMGPYDGIVAPTVDRVGRNVRDTLNTQTLLTSRDRVVVTADHAGVWDFSDPNQENEWLVKAWGSQMELRAIQKRNRDEAIRARKAGEPKQRPSYGYMYVRLAPMAKIDHVALDPVGAEVIREVARRILADETGKITVGTEAVRLNREGVPCPSDRRAQLYSRPMKGGAWTGSALKHILLSEAALGYLLHEGRPVTGADGRPVRIAEPLWDRATRDALVKATAPKRDGKRAPKGMRLLTGAAFCGNCGARLHVTGRGGDRRHPRRTRTALQERRGSVDHVLVELHLAVLGDHRHLGALAVHVDADVNRHCRVSPELVLSPGASCYRAELGRGPALIGSCERGRGVGP